MTHNRTGARGFTLLEMIVATLIMGIAVAGLLSGISGATRNAIRLRDYDRVTQLGREQMNRLLTDYTLPHGAPIADQFDRNITGGLEVGWRAQLTTPEHAPAPGPGALALDRIELEVWWRSGSQQHSFVMEGFRKRFMTSQEMQ